MVFVTSKYFLVFRLWIFTVAMFDEAGGLTLSVSATSARLAWEKKLFQPFQDKEMVPWFLEWGWNSDVWRLLCLIAFKKVALGILIEVRALLSWIMTGSICISKVKYQTACSWSFGTWWRKVVSAILLLAEFFRIVGLPANSASCLANFFRFFSDRFRPFSQFTSLLLHRSRSALSW